MLWFMGSQELDTTEPLNSTEPGYIRVNEKENQKSYMKIIAHFKNFSDSRQNTI